MTKIGLLTADDRQNFSVHQSVFDFILLEAVSKPSPRKVIPSVDTNQCNKHGNRINFSRIMGPVLPRRGHSQKKEEN